jgi:signal transduction histidine kinase
MIDDPFIEVKVSPNNQGIVIDISDNGQGIKKEYQGKIFDMFYRASETNSGSGLGLYIVKETIEKLGGQIQVTSQWNSGTTFTVHIPRT